MELSPEIITTVLQVGGAPALIALLVYKTWNGTSERIRTMTSDMAEMKDDVKDVRERVIKLEAKREGT